jgi:hypothetical protein
MSRQISGFYRVLWGFSGNYFGKGRISYLLAVVSEIITTIGWGVYAKGAPSYPNK